MIGALVANRKPSIAEGERKSGECVPYLTMKTWERTYIGCYSKGNKIAFGFFLVAVVNFFSVPLHAQEETLKEFINRADVVVYATITSKDPGEFVSRTMQPDGRIMEAVYVFTKYKITVLESIKEYPSRSIAEFHLPGGKIGDRHIRRETAPEFEVGENIVVALEFDELNNWFSTAGVFPLGRKAGAFLVVDAGGEKLAIPYMLHRAQRGTIPKDGYVRWNVESGNSMLDLIEMDALDFDSFWNSARSAVQ